MPSCGDGFGEIDAVVDAVGIGEVGGPGVGGDEVGMGEAGVPGAGGGEFAVGDDVVSGEVVGNGVGGGVGCCGAGSTGLHEYRSEQHSTALQSSSRPICTCDQPCLMKVTMKSALQVVSGDLASKYSSTMLHDASAPSMYVLYAVKLCTLAYINIVPISVTQPFKSLQPFDSQDLTAWTNAKLRGPLVWCTVKAVE